MAEVILNLIDLEKTSGYEKSLCYGCGKCCQNPHFLATSQKDFDTLSEGNKPVELSKSKFMLMSIIAEFTGFLIGKEKGMFFLKTVINEKPTYEIYLKGVCGNLDSQGKCSVYDHRPVACAEYQVGSLGCKTMRLLAPSVIKPEEIEVR